jgi:cell division protein FtsB
MEPAARTARTPRTASAPRRAPRTTRPTSRVRWDRIARCALLVVLLGVLFLYIGPARTYLSTYHHAQAARAQVAVLERQNHVLKAERRALHSPLAVERAARRLGMIKAGERPFVVHGLPSAR